MEQNISPAQIRRPNRWVWAIGTGGVWWAAAMLTLFTLSIIAPALLCTPVVGLIAALAPLTGFGVGVFRGWRNAEQQNQQIDAAMAAPVSDTAQPSAEKSPQQQVTASTPAAVVVTQNCPEQKKSPTVHADRVQARAARKFVRRATQLNHAEAVHEARTLAADLRTIGQ